MHQLLLSAAIPDPATPRLTGKVALITGAARGQGAAEARLFASEGARVVLGDVADDDGKALADELGDAAVYQHHDVASESAWTDIVEETRRAFGRIDILVNNAGILELSSLLNTSADQYRRIVEVNQVGPFLGMKAVAPVMIAQEGGSIVNISSVAGLQGTPWFFAYGATKWAVRGMTKTAALELAPHHIRVNSVHPGLVKTAMLDQIGALAPPEVLRQRVPLGEMADADDVARLVLFLASDESRHCTGSEFVVDGGMTA